MEPVPSYFKNLPNTVRMVSGREFTQAPEWVKACSLTEFGGTHACWVCSAGEFTGQRMWHSRDLLKKLGLKKQAQGKGQTPAPAVRIMLAYPLENILRLREEPTSTESYITERCKHLNGKTVRYALQEFHYSKNGAMKKYASQDLRYDLTSSLHMETPSGLILPTGKQHRPGCVQGKIPAKNKAKRVRKRSEKRATQNQASSMKTPDACATKKQLAMTPCRKRRVHSTHLPTSSGGAASGTANATHGAPPRPAHQPQPVALGRQRRRGQRTPADPAGDGQLLSTQSAPTGAATARPATQRNGMALLHAWRSNAGWPQRAPRWTSSSASKLSKPPPRRASAEGQVAVTGPDTLMEEFFEKQQRLQATKESLEFLRSLLSSNDPSSLRESTKMKVLLKDLGLEAAFSGDLIPSCLKVHPAQRTEFQNTILVESERVLEKACGELEMRLGIIRPWEDAWQSVGIKWHSKPLSVPPGWPDGAEYKDCMDRVAWLPPGWTRCEKDGRSCFVSPPDGQGRFHVRYDKNQVETYLGLTRSLGSADGFAGQAEAAGWLQ